MNPAIPRSAVFRDRRRIDEVAEVTPGLPIPTLTPALAVFDYRHVVHAADAREATGCALAILAYALGVTFGQPKTETAGDFTPRYVREAVLLPSGYRVVVISRVPRDDELDGADEDAAAEVPQFAGAA